MEDEIRPEIRELSFGSLLFRQIDRIMSLSTKDYEGKFADENKLFNFRWSVKLLRSLIPDDIIDDNFKKKEKDITHYNNNDEYKDRFEEVEKIFSLCINHLAEKGYLYKKVTDGEYEN